MERNRERDARRIGADSLEHELPVAKRRAERKGEYLDIRGQQSSRPELYMSDSYAETQKFGEAVRVSGGAGILYDSLRRRTGVNVVAHRPRNIADIAQTDHFEITVSSTGRNIEIRKLKA